MEPLRLALAGDTMLGRGVAQQLRRVGPGALFSADVRDLVASADLAIVNLECCISERGSLWGAHRPFHFRAPSLAVETLSWLGVDCVTLANNHALDYGQRALADTRGYLADAGIAVVGVGDDAAEARAGVVLTVGSRRVAVLGVADHPADFAADDDSPGTAYADLGDSTPGWLTDRVAALAAEADIVVVSPHWGPNMTAEPLPHVRRTAGELLAAGASLIAGHSAHVFHGVSSAGVLFDLGDFIDDYARHPVLRNECGLLFLVDVDADGPIRLEAYPLRLQFGYTRLAAGADRDWIRQRFTSACAELGTDASWQDGRLVIRWR